MATIMAVFAHPDDETFICGGTMAKHGHEGHRVVLVCATKGEMGRRMGVPPIATREDIPTIREQELNNACKVLQIKELRFLGYRDKLLEIQPSETLTQAVFEQMIEIKPDAVVTFHETLGGHPDHCAIGLATTQAFQMYQKCGVSPSKANLFYVSGSNAAKNPRQYGLLPQQMTKVHVKEYLYYKLLAFRAHKTQSEMDDWVWMRDGKSLKKFSEYEYFINAHPPYHGEMESLDQY
ncbi:PIG-L family deacetylase [Aquibacillus albus]|uniref:Bacillithiol biosynthesis deacetylase BshB2 n=1 Tax=Aquibacillus albus TaxID=1168171 RepID=A0ABS2N0J2_9BACI|nr:PIG-L family deacetylase [Aquibacillus albus]MBM7571652.1 bacillithiol biosynthesis deacetylase BshB2 [Aquibacillus albus]